MKRLLVALLFVIQPLYGMEVGRFQLTGTAAVVASSVTAGGTPNQMAARNCLTNLDLSNSSGNTCAMEVDDGSVKIWQIDLSSNTVAYGHSWPIGGYGPCGSRGQALTIQGSCTAFKIDALGTIEQ